MHVDLWLGGTNVLRDGGSYSYNISNEITKYYNGVSSHNSIQFDDRDQMPVLGRFLFGSWLKEIKFEFEYLGAQKLLDLTSKNDEQIEIKFDKKPYLNCNGLMIPIYNLHVHNKKKINIF